MTTASETSISRASVGLRSERGPILLALMICTILVAIESTIIATAVPTIVADLGGFSQFPWLFSIFLLTQAVTIPIYGTLGDLIGRKPVILVGISLFLVGSVLGAAAWSMTSLIAARAVQGLGAGAVLPMTMTIVGDLYSLQERAKVQGYIASMWGAASVIGPTLGGLFSEYLSWRWIFGVNLPIGLAAAFLLTRSFSEQVARRERHVDVAGAAVLAVSLSLIILALLEGGSRWGWTSPATLVCVVAGLVGLVVFALVERRAVEPILPPWLFTRRVLVGANLAATLVGALLIALTSYVPTYAQGVLGSSALTAGFALAAMTMGWPVAAAYAGRLYLRIGFRDTALIGSVVVTAGGASLLLLGAGSSIWQVAASTFVIGLGFGLVASPVLVAVQSVVGWERRGVVTATNLFGRTIGSALGIAAFGALANQALTSRLSDPPAGSGDLPSTADDAIGLLDGGDASGPVLDFVRGALFDATHLVFVGVAVLAVVLLLAVATMPRRVETAAQGQKPAEPAEPAPGPSPS